MSIGAADLSICDLEPIHIPGKIQSHGFLVVVDRKNTIDYVSSNIVGFIGQEPSDLLGKPLGILLSQFQSATFPDVLVQLAEGTRDGLAAAAWQNPLTVAAAGVTYNLIVTTGSEYTLLEFEPRVVAYTTHLQTISKVMAAIADNNTIQDLLASGAAQVKDIIEFDRVMVYQFAADGHGEVIAEAKNSDLTSLHGLHYPASDIPKQARELYKLNHTRLIADVASDPSDIVTTHPLSATLDLTHSQLRAVSPVHIQYLKNMGVASSFSISLLYKKELWGLIACHNYSPRFIDFELREAARIIGDVISMALEFRQDESDSQLQLQLYDKVALLVLYMQKNVSLENALTAQESTLLSVVYASGAALCLDNKIIQLGNTPDSQMINALMDWVSIHHNEGIYHSAALPLEFAPIQAFQHIAAGMLAIPLSKNWNDYIVWFKEEIIQVVKWAGNPDKPVERAGAVGHISPRHSFDTWVKQVSGTAAPWSKAEINAATRLKEEVLISISSRAGAVRTINERLHHAYEELDTFSYTVSHDLKTPLTAIKGYAQLLSTDTNLAPGAQFLAKRIADRTDKMNSMIKAVLHYSRVGRLPLDATSVDTAEIIQEIIQDLEQGDYQSKPTIRVGDLPPLYGDPILVWQVFSNLISNAVKYSQQASHPIVEIAGHTTDNNIFYSVKDNGIGIPEKNLDEVFLLFSRMDNVQGIEGTGVGLAIVKRIVEKHGGSIWAESELGKGTTFYLSFVKK